MEKITIYVLDLVTNIFGPTWVLCRIRGSSAEDIDAISIIEDPYSYNTTLLLPKHAWPFCLFFLFYFHKIIIYI